MAEIKRQQSESLDNYNDPKRMKLENTCLVKELYTQFEDLSNELLYEIFEFLDHHHVYSAFFNLNARFNNVLTKSTLPMQINVPLMSKSTFEQYRKDIIQPNQHRIQSLRVSNLFIYDRTFAFLADLWTFSRLRTLVLHNIQANDFLNVFPQLTSLSHLSALIISFVDHVVEENTVYLQIFRLPVLKYCKISSERRLCNSLLPPATDEFSPIEHLIINNQIYEDELHPLLTYVPRICRLSCKSISQTWRARPMPYALVLDHLKEVSLELSNVEFDRLLTFITHYCRTVETLRLSVSRYNDLGYLDANRWQHLIESYMPRIRIFDICWDLPATDPLSFETKVQPFTSPFWLERQWFFTYQYYQSTYRNDRVRFSTDPYRRKNYTLYRQSNPTFSSNSSTKTILKSVDHLHINHYSGKLFHTNYFPNVMKLTLEKRFATSRQSAVTILNNLIPLAQLTTLLLPCCHFPLAKLIEILCVTPNLRTLEIQSIPTYRSNYSSIEQSETFQLASKINNITKLRFKDKCKNEQLRILLALCPRMQCFTIRTLLKDFESRIRFLLDETNLNGKHLFALCILSASHNYDQMSTLLIESKVLPVHCMSKLVDSKLYLWW